MPENIPPAEHIKQVKKRIKGAAPHLELAEKDAKGLSGRQSKEGEMEKEKGGQ